MNNLIHDKIASLRHRFFSTAGVMKRLNIINEIWEARNSIADPRPARNPTGHFYDFDPNRKPAQRKKDNAAAMALLARIDAGNTTITGDDKRVLAKYSGTGGALIGADGKKGSAYEYYTPKPIAEGMWDLLRDLGFSGGKVLDPSAGTGIFGATAPVDAAIDAVELNDTAGRINAIVNAGPGYSETTSSFEKVATATPDDQYDAVITNVPFGELADRGSNALEDKRYQKEPLQNYFILRSLEKLRPGGLAIFITPPRCVSGKGGKEEDLRIKASYKAEFLGAYRLPNSVFGTAAADTITDVIAFRKFSRDAAEKISELREQNPEMLVSANVQWQEFIEGKYFQGDGHKFILGEFIPKNPAKFRDADKVVNPASIPDIAKMLRKFGASRIDWKLLNATETAPILYAEGDTVTQAGQTLRLQDGRWVALASNGSNADMAKMLANCVSPYTAFESGVTWADADGLVRGMLELSQAIDIPDWLRGTHSQLSSIGDADRCWNAGVVGLACKQVMQERVGDKISFLAEYALLSEAMQRVSSAKSPTVLQGEIRAGMDLLSVHYSKKLGFSAVWRGDVIDEVVSTTTQTPDGKFDGARYKNRTHWVDLSEAKRIYGETFDPMADPALCLSADGLSVTRADDYYVGNYKDFLVRMDTEIASAPSDLVRQKLLRQKLDADARITRPNISSITFSLSSPLVTLEEKAEFLRRFVHPAAAVIYDEKTGEQRVDIDIKSSRSSGLTDEEKLLNRVGDYMKNGTVTIGGAKLDLTAEQALHKLRETINRANEQFNGWARSNPEIIGRLTTAASDPSKLQFAQISDEGPLTIPGLNPDLALHGYQNAFVRRMGRKMAGVNGFDVGLGKTYTALAAVQHMQAIGVKKKTAFVVPNSVLSNWKREAEKIYASTPDCLYVGLRANKKGKLEVNSSTYDSDLISIMENRHAKIFMSYEAWERIRLKDETIDNYEQFLREWDASFAYSQDKKEDERAKGKQSSLLQVLRDKKGSSPYLEDLGIDSVVFDEAHLLKNSIEVVDFKSARFLSLANASDRGVDSMAKAWYLRKLSPRADGVLSLTATPITNSPLEIYSMVALAVGHERVNNLCLSNGADSFMDMFTEKQNQDELTIDGILKSIDVFVGLKNVSLLRNLLNDSAVIENATSVGAQVVVPESEEIASSVDLPDSLIETLMLYKKAYRFASDTLHKKPTFEGMEEFDAVSDKFGEPMDLIGCPFNLINKMSLLILDPEMDRRSSVYLFDAADTNKISSVVGKFNALKIKEIRSRMSPLTKPESVVGRIVKKDEETGKEKVTLKIEVWAEIDSGNHRVVIDTLDPETQARFVEMVEKTGTPLDVTVPPKLAALIENIQKEQSSPRGIDGDGNVSPIVKQIIFCDALAMHGKIRILLSKRAGISTSKIAIITGRVNNTPDQIQSVQDGFNAHGEDNLYQIVIANEKAEVGINLQRGTQAIHHLSIGFTPDSLTQRNGRGVRQGNKTERVTIYYYDAEGTFDSYKRTMVNKKSEWINEVLDKEGGDSVEVSGGLSPEQQDALIQSVGDADAITRIKASVIEQEIESRAKANRSKQETNLDTIIKQRAFIEEYGTAEKYIAKKVIGFLDMKKRLFAMESRNGDKIARIRDDLQSRISTLQKEIDTSATFKHPMEEVVAGRWFNDKVRTVKDKIEEITKNLTATIEGPIYAEWDSEVNLAKAMAEEALKSFVAQSKAKGGISASVAEGFAKGEGFIRDGVRLVKGTFLRTSDGILYVATENNIYPYLGYRDKITEVIYSGSPGYDAAITEAAKIEDADSSRGLINNGYSSIVPEVSERRTTESVTEYYIDAYLLPPPYFPIVFPSWKIDSPVSQSIRNEQSEIVRVAKNMKFTVPTSVKVIKMEGENYINEDSAIIEYTKAHPDLKLTGSDIDAEKVARFIDRDLDEKDKEKFSAALVGDTEEEIHSSAKRWIGNLAPWYDWDRGHIDYSFRTVPISLHHTLKVAIEALKPKPIPSDAPEAVVAEKAVSKKVAIYGETKLWKEEIKACGKNNGGFGVDKATPGVWKWILTRKAWESFTNQYPSAAAKMTVEDWL